MRRLKWWEAAALAGVVFIGTAAAECGDGSGGSGDTQTTRGLPDGTVTSKRYKPSSKLWELCVKPESGGAIKCNDDFTKDEVNGCHEGDFWPDCYHLPVKKGTMKDDE